MKHDISLDDKYTAREGRVFMSGTQALVRLPMVQMWRDRAAGLKTGTYISGYRGSPIGGYDMQLARAKKHLDPLDIVFQPGVNEELAATAIWGTQQLSLSPGARKEGVLGIWYGKGPGVDRSGDVFKHGNAAGTSPKGGVLCIAGDDHGCKSSTIPHQSDHAFAAALMPMVYPSNVHEFVEMGLFAIAMSRYSGCWTAMKCIADTIETSAAVDLSGEGRQFVTPDDFEMPPDGLHWRWPDVPMSADQRLMEYKGYAALAFARANGVDIHTWKAETPRYGIVASGKAFEDTMQALTELELDEAACERLGLSIYKVRMPWPLEPEGIRHFAEGLNEVMIVEERREMIENQIKQQLFNWRADVRPRIVGKFDDRDRPCLPFSDPLTAITVARALAKRLLMRESLDDGMRAHLDSRLAVLDARARASNDHAPPVLRTPYFCSGCPHNTSTRVPEGSRATAGIGCHYMALWMDRRTEGFTQMGGEGVSWLSQAHFTDEAHHFANLGDGTYFHSGLLAVRAAVASKVNITYKILYNDAVAMTGGQGHDGDLSPDRITRQLAAEGVSPIYLLSDTPELYTTNLASGVIVKHRDDLDAVMRLLREEKGCSAIVYVQTCAAEKRRRRKRGLMEDPAKRVFINPEVCEGCGDCSIQSNCVSIEPLETEMGRKRQINQSSCNKDFSCLKGFCPSFVTVTGGALKKPDGAGSPPVEGLDEPSIRSLEDGPVNIAVTGVGGTGVLTIGAILGMAAHLDGKGSMVLDMAGLAQKGGAVLSHVRIGKTPNDVTAPRISAGRAHVMLAADDVVAAGVEGLTLCNIETTTAVVNTAVMPVANFVRQRDFDFKAHAVEGAIRKATREDSRFVNFTRAALGVAGDAIASNIMMVGYASQMGLLPVSRAAIERAIRLNNVAVDANLAAFGWGRVIAAQPEKLAEIVADGTRSTSLADMSVAEIITHRAAHLEAYQNRALAETYRARLQMVADAGAGETVLRTVAVQYARVLAYKDEYEVARLLAADGFRTRTRDRFDGDVRLSFHLAPPMLPGKDASGRPKKRAFGPWVLPLLRGLARLKGLRGGRFDIFGRTAERRAERALIERYEAAIDTCIAELTPSNSAQINEILSSVAAIRGFGPVKDAAMEEALQVMDARLAELTDGPAKVAAE